MIKFSWAIPFYFFYLLTFNLFAQVTISGQIKNIHTSQGLSGATIQSKKGNYFAVTDNRGGFQIPNLPKGKYTFNIRFLGFQEKIISLTLQKNEWINIELEEKHEWTNEVIVYATRVSEQDPIAFTHIDKEELRNKNTERDMPLILNQTPSLIAVSDAGTGIGYTNLRIRGSDVTRINITINGISFNDSESHGVFWVNMPDIASSAQSVQIQRGVGTSTNGAGAFGASININTSSQRKKAYLETTQSYGSFNTHRHTINFGSGLIGSSFTCNGRLSLIQSDGFIDRAFSNLKSFYCSGKYQKKKTTLEVMIFGGNEITYQSWYGVPVSRLNNDTQEMINLAQSEGWNTEQKNNLLTSNNRTFNLYTYKNQVDNYTQDHYQVHITHHFNTSVTANISLHYTYGRGFFEEFKYNQKFSNYGLENPIIQTNTITRTNLIRRRALDNNFYGITYSASYKKEKYNSIIGGAWNAYQGDHFGKIIWAEIASTVPKDVQYYFNRGDKYDFNMFWKNKYKVSPHIRVFLDLQYRGILYQATGLRPTQQNITSMNIDKTYHFFNPKIGLTYTLSPHNRIYISYSIAQREPIREDFVNAPVANPSNAERVDDIELGWRIKRKKYSFNINGYWMEYLNQRVLAGEINDVGASIRTPVSRSYRMGVEIEGSLQIGKKIVWNANIAFSKNKIENFTETVYNYGINFDKKEKLQYHFKNIDISFSPSIVAGSCLTYTVTKNLSLSLFTKYVGDYFLDNTSNKNRKIKPYLVNDLKIAYTIKPTFIKEATLSIFINNILNEQYESHGYTYGYRTGRKTVRQNYYFPQAGINYTAMISILF